MHLHVACYDFHLQHMQVFLKVALLKLYAHFRETLCCVQPTTSRKCQEWAKAGIQIVTCFVHCTFYNSTTLNSKLRVVFLQLCLEYW
jgi:hypothetical protein